VSHPSVRVHGPSFRFACSVNSAITHGRERVMAQAVCDWPVTKEALLQS
jgi:hypothetical protein